MSETGISELTRILPPERVTNDPTELTVYGYDGTWLERRPDVAVSVVSADEVAGVLRWANQHQIPVVPRGAGSGLAGGSVPISGGVVMNTTLMTSIKSIDRRRMRAVVEPGVVNADLQAAVEREGLFYPPRPGQPAPIYHRRQRRYRRKRASVSQVRGHARVRPRSRGRDTHRRNHPH